MIITRVKVEDFSNVCNVCIDSTAAYSSRSRRVYKGDLLPSKRNVFQHFHPSTFIFQQTQQQ